MNYEIASERYKDVLRVDVINADQSDFLATHVPVKNLYITHQPDVTDQDRKQSFTEEQVYEKLVKPGDDDRFVLIKGSSGTGKSHLIRWFKVMLDVRKQDNESIMFIRRDDNTLKGTLRQLLEMPEIKNLPDQELYKKLTSAATSVPEKELKNLIYHYYLVKIESDDGKGGYGDERRISNVDRNHLIALMNNSLFKELMLADDGPIDRIYTKFAENKNYNENDVVIGFKDEDFSLDAYFIDELIKEGADFKAKKIAKNMVDDREYSANIAKYVNTFNEEVIRQCTGLQAGDLNDAIKYIRQELYKQNRNLTIFIEDITSTSGINSDLIDALLTKRSGLNQDENLCRLNAIVGATDSYYHEFLREHFLERINYYVNVPDDLFENDPDGLVEFFARYLNTLSLPKSEVDKWAQSGATPDTYPIHQVTIGDGWGEYEIGTDKKKINLFPFNKRAIKVLYKNQNVVDRKPRLLIKNIIERYVEDALDDMTKFPTYRPTIEAETAFLNANNSFMNYDTETVYRLAFFIYVWGNDKLESYEKNHVKYISNIPESIFEDLKLPIIDGKKVETPVGNFTDPITVLKPKVAQHTIPQNTKENERIIITLQEVDKWIEHKDYKLSIGATTKNVRDLNDVRKNINDYLYNVIDWASEGVPIDAMIKIQDTGNKFLVAFERQTMKSDAVVTLSASLESRKIIEAFLRWNIVGNKSWNFDGAADFLYRVEKWTEKVKPLIIHDIMHYSGKKIEYFKYAVAAEYFRLILNGYCKSYQNTKNLSPDLLLKKNEVLSESNGHTKAWNDLLKMTNGSDGIDNRNCVLQYYNLQQGTSKSSTNYEYDYVEFNKAVKKVLNTGLHFLEDDLQLDDPVRKRRLTSEYLKKILDRIDTIVSEEKQAIFLHMESIKAQIDIGDIDSEEGIKDITTQIKKFYTQTQTSHVGIAVRYDASLINQCQRNASSIYSGIKAAMQALIVEDSVEALLRLSKDPLNWLVPFDKLLSSTADDIAKANAEISRRKVQASVESSDQDESQYSVQKQQIAECKQIIEEVKKSHVDG